MSDDLGLFTDDSGEEPRRSRQQVRESRDRFRRRRRRRSVTALVGVFVLLIVGAGVLYGAGQILRIGVYDDYEGPGSGEVVVKVDSGDSVSSIGSTLAQRGVVASSKAFRSAAADNRATSGVQPGYYMMKNRMSGAAAVQRILSPESKTGQLEIRGGMRLDDQVSPHGEPTPGILSLLAKASCTGAKQGQCTTPEQVQETAKTADLASLGVPDWAVGAASKAEPNRRLEGLIMPGVYDVKPGEKPQELLRQVMTKSVARLQAAGLPQSAAGTGHSPYEVLTIASLTQSEALSKDFSKVSRVIENRLEQHESLKFDSTINYPLDKPALLTKSADRQLPGAYNTYQNQGLPPTPISSVSKEAVAAGTKPAPGDWVYFVKCFPDGTSCFAKTQTEHDQNIKQAQQRGAY